MRSDARACRRLWRACLSEPLPHNRLARYSREADCCGLKARKESRAPTFLVEKTIGAVHASSCPATSPPHTRRMKLSPASSATHQHSSAVAAMHRSPIQRCSGDILTRLSRPSKGVLTALPRTFDAALTAVCQRWLPEPGFTSSRCSAERNCVRAPWRSAPAGKSGRGVCRTGAHFPMSPNCFAMANGVSPAPATCRRWQRGS